MPDIDNLLQEWPVEVEEKLNQFGLPTAQLDTSLTNSIDIICGKFNNIIPGTTCMDKVIELNVCCVPGLLDIPIYESRIQSLHVLFSLYIAVKSAKHGGEP